MAKNIKIARQNVTTVSNLSDKRIINLNKLQIC